MYTDHQWMVPYWTRQEDKIFEQKIVEIPDGVVDRWHLIAQFLPGKSPQDVASHYEDLFHDVRTIEEGWMDQLNYPEDEKDRVGPTRKKGRPWTEEEHRNFLRGMDKYGKGDWRSISRNFVISRTPTQVASHAQKYFLRQTQLQKKERKRSSIHDITTGVDSIIVDPPTLPNNHHNPAQFEIGGPPDSHDPGHFQDFGNPPNSHDGPGHFQDFGNPPNSHDGPGHFQDFGNPPNNYVDPGHFQNFGHPMQ